jgi:hypothetical protein
MSMKLPARHEERPLPGELLEDEPLPAAATRREAGELDVELDRALSGHEGILLGRPDAGPVELDLPHLAGEHPGEGNEPGAAARREVLEGERFAGELTLADLHGGRERLAEEALALVRVFLFRRREARLERDVRGLQRNFPASQYIVCP